MDIVAHIERNLVSAVNGATGGECPPLLAAAVRHSVFAGGARIRPRLSLAVALACGNDHPAAADAAASAVELLHCASLVHDDLPCFDDAALRRGKPSVHRLYGERLAVLAGDALIVLAYQTAAQGAQAVPARIAPVISILSAAVGMPRGIAAGQAWECEPRVDLSDYHRAKTGALFVGAAAAGAAAAGADGREWHALGQNLGEAYQVADDIRDATATEAELGKPVGRDAALGRPSSTRELGLAAAVHYFEALVAQAIDSVPRCAGASALRALIRNEALRLVPEDVIRRAA
jgi:geranylgeranyl diphosphate synthase type II